MTNKTIIDGIDESKCKYKIQSSENFKTKPYCSILNKFCEDISFVCDKNCQVFEDLKQLARAKEEINGYKTIIKKIRQEVQEDVTCKSRECGCDSYEECIECLKNTILNIIDEERNDFMQDKVICKECGKYKQALDSIENICRNVLDDDYIRNLAFALLDIINKAKDGE